MPIIFVSIFRPYFNIHQIYRIKALQMFANRLAGLRYFRNRGKWEQTKTGGPMQTITIAERLWLEPTLLGATLNYSELPNGWHYRVGIGFRSLAECDKSLQTEGSTFALQDNSLVICRDKELYLTFCPGTPMERQIVLSGEALDTFKSAIHYLTLSSEPRKN
jgi:hypothetical protein